MTVAITRSDRSASELRQAAADTQDAKAARRMLAIALVLEGWSREAASEACAMDRQTLRDWVHRYNADGLEGLFNQPRRNGPPPRLSAEQLGGYPRGSSKVLTSSGTAWCGGVASICNSEFARSSRSSCMRVRWASCCASCRSGTCRYVRSIRTASRMSRRFSARVSCSCSRRSAARGGWQTGRGVVRR